MKLASRESMVVGWENRRSNWANSTGPLVITNPCRNAVGAGIPDAYDAGVDRAPVYPTTAFIAAAMTWRSTPMSRRPTR